MPDLVIGLCTHGDTLRVARSQEINTWETRAFLPPLDEGLVHAVVDACKAQDPTGVSTGIHPATDAHGEPMPGAFQAHGRLRGAPGGEAHHTAVPPPAVAILLRPPRPRTPSPSRAPVRAATG